MSVRQPPKKTGSRHKLDALIRRLKTPRRGGLADSIPRRAGDGPWPLSFAQRRLWLLDRLEPGRATYNMPGALELRADAADPPIDVAALAAAVAALTQRHEALRVRFSDGFDGPTQHLVDSPTPFAVVDLDALPSAARRPERDRLARREARRPFDLRHGPLWRVALLREETRHGLLLLHLHHVAADGWTLGILFTELVEFYAAVREGRLARLAALSVGYVDFAVWQQGAQTDDALADDLAFWREQLDDVPVLDLPFDRPRPVARLGLGGEVRRPLLDPAALAGLDALARGRRATRFHTLVAVVQALLGRVSGQRDFALGTPVAGRDRPEFEGIVGIFVNTLVLRLRPHQHRASFAEFIDHVRETALAADGHRAMPFERLVELLRPERRGGVSPFFQVMLTIEDAMPSRRAAGLALQAHQTSTGTAKFDLMLYLRTGEDGLEALLEYDRELFDHTTVERLARRLERLLADVVARPETPVAGLDLLDAAERQQVVVEWNDTAGADPRRRLLPDLLRRQAAARPDAVALDGPDGVLTYAALTRRMDALARELGARGVGAETAVALETERSTAMVVAMAAILEAGGFYVPVDPGYPEERRGWMLDDAEAEVRIVDHPSGVAIVGRAIVGRAIVGKATGDGGGITGEALAYVMYTSGSTGRPKGVAVTHADIVRLVHEAGHTQGRPGDVHLQISTPSFDASTFEIWSVLIGGGRLVVPPPGRLGLEEIAALLPRHRVSTLWLTAGLFHQMVDTELDALGQLRHLWAGGDVLSPTHVRRLLERHSGCTTLTNGYGPTENTVFSTTYRMAAAADLDRATVPIGRVIERSTAHVLDADGRPAPPGSKGELQVGGFGVARGYFKRPAMTAERFVPDPFAELPGMRLYRTGDQVRFLADGRIEFFGRADGQVKIRGFRIEPGEIENAFAELPGVEQTAILVHPGTAGDKRLAIYFTRQASAPPTAELRRLLGEKLPAHMVPSIFVELEAMPLNPNGKLDRAALGRMPLPTAGDDGSTPRAATQGKLEEGLAEIWSELLGLAAVGAEDDFFAHGGHSLLATQAVSRIRRRFDVELPLAEFFEQPTVRGLAASLRARRRAAGKDLPPPLEAVPRDAPLLASFAQERMWFLERLDPGRATYLVPLGIDLRGPLDAGALAAALGGLIARHEALRTSFREEVGRPILEIHPPIARIEPLPVVDLGRLGEGAEDLARARARASRELSTRPFDLERAPLLRAALLRAAPEAHLLVLNLHHLVADGWSLGILVRDFGLFYAAHRRGAAAELAAQPITYADYAAWQRRALSDARLEPLLATWRRRLGGVPALDLPVDVPRAVVSRGTSHTRGAMLDVALPAERVAALGSRAQGHGATLFMALLATWASLLGRFAGQRDFAVGSPVAGRTRREIEDLIGLFVNTLALRIDLGGAPSFAELLGRVREVTLEAYELQEVPFEKLVEALDIPRDKDRPLLVQAMLVLQNAPFEPLQLEGLELTPHALATGTAKLDLHLALTEAPDGTLQGFLEYNRDLFDAASIERLWAAYEVLLDGLEKSPETALDALPILPEADRLEILARWQAAEAPFEPAALHHRFEAQVDATPDAPALLFDDGAAVADDLPTWTYRELDRAANRLAHLLRALGVRREHRVGVLMERSLDLVASLLAVLKAGAAFVPLDPFAPLDRLRFMVAELGAGHGAPILLTQGHLHGVRAALGESMLLRAVEVDRDPRLAEMSTERPALPVDLDQAAYMIYTSGSTGRPKGVVNAHRGISNRLDWARATLPIGPGDRVLQKTPITFDVSVWEFFWPLTSGVPLVLARPEGHKDPAYLAGLIRRAAITTLHFVPSMLQVFVDEPEARGGFPAVRRVLASGEALTADLVERGREVFDAPLDNLYGPTEAAVEVTWWACDVDAPILRERRRVPIGRPIANVYTPIVDRRFELVPIGVAGELCLGGVQVARGYHARPGLTAERFVPDPWSTTTGARCGGKRLYCTRLYRTGDLVRQLADGAIDYLGRIDFQVKLRGQRIELGEIEAALLDRPEIREAVVVLRRDGGEDRLVAYLTAAIGTAAVGTAAAEPEIDLAALRGALAGRLPEAMIPAAFVILEVMPLNANGKIDRLRLPAPSFDAASEHVAPRTALEADLVEIWRDLLGVEQVGVTDSFFTLGGHSLLATRLAAHLRERFGVEVELRRIFKPPTIEALAAHLVTLGGEAEGASRPRLERRAEDAEPVASFAQERLWLLDQLEPGAVTYHLPFALDLRGPLDDAALDAALGAVARRHDVLRTAFAKVGGAPRPVVAETLPRALVRVDLRALDAARRQAASAELLARLARRPFDLATPPLWRAALLRTDQAAHTLLVVQHHILSDGWSIGLFVRELALGYGAARAGTSPPWPSLPVRYADYAAWQRRVLSPERLAELAAAWRERLDGLEPLELLTDRPRPPARRERGASVALDLSRHRAAVDALAARRGATPFVVLLAAWTATLARFTGRRDLAVAAPVAHRTHPDVEHLIGFFVNTLVLRLELDGRAPFTALVDHARERTREAQAHEDIPFEKLVALLAPPRDASRTPFAQVLFAYQDAFHQGREGAVGGASMDGLKLAVRGVDTGTVKMDLVLGLETRLVGTLDYDVDLFDRTTIERLVGAFEGLLGAALEAPERPLAELPILSPEDRRRFAAWNATDRELTLRPLGARFEAQVDRTPDAVALLFEAQALTYGDLDRRASRLARSLRRLGIRADGRVGVLLERSPNLLVALLGIVKAGAAWVPLDPSYPEERLAFMLEDFMLEDLAAGSAPLLLVERSTLALAGRLTTATGAEARAVTLDAADAAWRAEPAARLDLDISLEQAAYTLYTSGSTGRPKGVVNNHRGIANRLVWMQDAFPIGAADRVLQKTPMSFDVSVWEFFWPLLEGAALVLAKPEGHKDPAYLARLIRRTGITTLHFVPSMLQVFLDEPGIRGGFPRLRHVPVSGEALPADLVERFDARLGAGAGQRARLHNLYGPTEAAVDVTWWACDIGAAIFRERRRVPIGRPIFNTRTHVVDPLLHRVPIGVAGELCLGGVQVARGYHGRPGLTAERFCADPWSTAPGGRLYRTGDLVRWLAEGEIDYLGRLDFQIKLRGQRIELGEIESALLARPEVREAVVGLWTRDADGRTLDPRLVAHLVASPEAVIEVDLLARQLGARLPEIMVPSSFVVLDAMPLNPSGKVDRKRLPPPAGPTTAGVAEGWDDPLEEVVAGVWSEVLGVEGIGPLDDFFQLGGHSLLATQMMARLRGAFEVDLPLARVFAHPTVRGLTAAARAERLAQGGAALSTALPPPLARRAEDGPAPLSFAQERLWFLEQLEPDAGYHLAQAFELRGTVAPAILGAAFAAVARRHQALRTTFAQTDDGPVQIVAPASSARRDLPEVDLGALAIARARDERQRLVDEIGRRPFDLERGPVWRTLLIRRTPTLGSERDGESVDTLVVDLHHILSDGWSTGVLLRDLAAAYRQALDGEPVDLLPLAVQYSDYAVWQRSWLGGGELERQLAFWREELADLEEFELPLDHPRPAALDLRGKTLGIRLSPPLGHGLREFARRSGATLFMVFAAALAAFLGRLSGVRDVTLGTPTAGRRRPELEDLIGFFVNTLVLRADLSSPRSFSELVDRTRRRALDADAHQDIPFQKLVETLWRGDRRLTPFFRVMLAWQNAPTAAVELPDLRIETLDMDLGISKFDLSLLLAEQGEEFAGWWAYRADLFDPTTIRRWARSFETLLAGIVADPELALDELPLLSSAERHQVRVEWNAQPTTPLELAPLHELVAEQACRAPDRIALETEHGAWTYGALFHRAQALAGLLRDHGVGRESIVGVALDRSSDLTIALLAILQAGGAFLPLDTAFPVDRLAAMLADAGDPPVLFHSHLRSRLPAEARALDIQVLEHRARRGAGLAAAPTVDLEQPAYILYTSGSTGRPKGVVVPHRAIAQRLLWVVHNELDADGRFLQKTSPSFDGSMAEIFAPLLIGGVSIAMPPGSEKESADLVRWIVERRVTHTSFPPALLDILLTDGSVARCRGLRQVLVGGEKVREEMPVRFYELLPRSISFEVRYGPTETTISVTTHRCRDDRGDGGVLPIGRPIAGAEILILDRDERLAPVGLAGELLIAGPTLTRGYFDHPARTAESFVPHPFPNRPGERIYRSGDLVRRRADGEIEFLGRIDRQVKIRGFRVELGEIEAALRDHPAVRQAVVLDLPDGATRKLAAVVTSEEGDRVDVDRLLDFAAERLPAHMVPPGVAVLDEMPTTTLGKIDRRALEGLAVELTPSTQAGERIAPRGELEERLVAIWRELLERDDFGTTDDFFALGGHSILATRVLARLRGEFGVELPLRAFFEAPTVAQLARKVEARDAEFGGLGEAAPPLVALPRRPDADGAVRLAASFAQERLWILDQMMPGDASYNIPAAIRLVGEIDAVALGAAFDALARRHETLRTTLEAGSDGTGAVQRIAPPPRRTLATVDLQALVDARDEARRLARAEADRPFDLAQGPLLRAALLWSCEESGEESENVLLATFHHSIADGWSIGVFLRELTTLYTAAQERRAAPLAPLAVQYADFATWQRGRLAGDELERQLAFWRAHLDGAPDLIDLPTDRPRPALFDPRGETFPWHLDGTRADALRTLAERADATVFMVLLALWTTLLHRLGAGDDVVVGSPIAGRGRAETEPLIGFFVNTLALRARPRAALPFAAHLAELRDLVLDASAHQDLPFEKLVAELAPRRDRGHTPIFQVVLSHLPAPPRAALAGTRLEPLELETRRAKVDLGLAVIDPGARGQGLRGGLDYRLDLFDPAGVERFAEILDRLLDGVLDDPEAHLGELPVLGPSSRRQILEIWGRGKPAPPRAEDDLWSVVAKQVHERPDAVALRTGDDGHRALTYGELGRCVLALAKELRRRGVGPEVRVGIEMERSGEAIVALLGVLAAGGAYVPLDPAYPEERLDFMREDSGIELVVGWDGIHGCAQGRAQDRSTPDRTAYIIYTSGSTGRPKGVAVPHRGVLGSLAAARRLLRTDRRSRGLQMASLSFDASVLEIWLILGAGGTLHSPPREELLADPVGLLRRRGITHLVTVPSFLTTVDQEVPTLEAMSIGGEACPGELAARWAARLRLFNFYAPTELSIFTTAYRHPSDARFPGPPPVGRPIAGTRVVLLDRGGRLAAPGVPGELCGGGTGVVRGYLGRPALTAERFVPDPWSPSPGARLYRSGDLARWTADGELELLGRTDHQVKVRGVRVELGEIETALAALPGVAQAAVLLRRDLPTGHGLAAFVVGAGIDPQTLREQLRAHLPEAMIPAAFVHLENLPRLPTGKLDRTALGRHQVEAGDPQAATAPPRDALEARLAELWANLLGRQRVGINDDFFALGGDSLKAALLVRRLRAELDAPLPVAALFDAPTIAGLAARARDLVGQSETLLRRAADGDGTPIVLLPPIFGDPQVFRPLLTELAARHPVYTAQARGLYDDAEPHAAIEDMAIAYLEELRRIVPSGPYALVGASLGGAVAFDMARRLRAAGEDVELVLLDTADPGTIPTDSGALETIRATLLERLAEQGQAVDNAWIDRQASRIEAQGRALASYAPPRLRGDLLHVRAEASAERLAEPERSGWALCCEGVVRVEITAGDHESMLQASHVGETAARIVGWIAKP